MNDVFGVQMHFHEPDTAVLVINDAMARDEGLYSISARNVVGSVSFSVSIRIEENESAYAYATYSGRLGMREHKPNKNRFIDEFYDLGEELGRGTQGVTYHAVERLTGEWIPYGHTRSEVTTCLAQVATTPRR